MKWFASFNLIHNEEWGSLLSAALGCRLTCDWSKWMMTFRSAGRSLGPPLMADPAEGSSCGEKHACNHSVHVIIWNFCILSSLMRIILLRKSLTSWSLMALSSCRPSRDGGLGWEMVQQREDKNDNFKFVFINMLLQRQKESRYLYIHLANLHRSPLKYKLV